MWGIVLSVVNVILAILIWYGVYHSDDWQFPVSPMTKLHMSPSLVTIVLSIILNIYTFPDQHRLPIPLWKYKESSTIYPISIWNRKEEGSIYIFFCFICLHTYGCSNWMKYEVLPRNSSWQSVVMDVGHIAICLQRSGPNTWKIFSY